MCCKHSGERKNNNKQQTNKCTLCSDANDDVDDFRFPCEFFLAFQDV